MTDASAGGAPRRFSSVTGLVRRAPNRYDADVDPEWSIGGRPNGGYLLALMARAAVASGNQPHPIAASAHYLRPPVPGPAAIHTEVRRAGRTVDQVRVHLAQGEHACVEAVVTTARLERHPHVRWDGGVPPRPAAGFDECVPSVGALPDGGRIAILDQIELRLEPSSTGFTRGEPSGRGELRGWLRLRQGEAFDPVSLLFAVDSFPPASFDVAPSGWVPTLELTAYVRALPAPGPVAVVQQARMIAGDRVDEACFVWDAEGRLVAQATQLAGIRHA